MSCFSEWPSQAASEYQVFGRLMAKNQLTTRGARGPSSRSLHLALTFCHSTVSMPDLVCCHTTTVKLSTDAAGEIIHFEEHVLDILSICFTLCSLTLSHPILHVAHSQPLDVIDTM